MRLGVLGGTYDPIHLGHLLVAEQAREALGLDQLILVPAGRPPHKPGRPLSPFEVRLRMVLLAIEGAPGLAASELERDTSRPSYTVETLRRLREETTGLEELWLVLGADSLQELHTWLEPEGITRLSHLAVYPRPDAEASPDLAAAGPLAGATIRILEGPRLRLSSTEIRQRVRDGRSIRFLVPEAVRRFILEAGLYREGRSAPGAGGTVPGGVGR